ncbi:PucR family transcriptional regulator [Anaerotruncus rubiinfantis]|uniref:PucR family transcriptional regulator n=1 Tax=Anaerotruncus rubiinfantis TaxID=1720200 RepID=UPI0008361DEF|nr:PucR family transcriptional regulator [Anaerotruncus rubiinfantis]
MAITVREALQLERMRECRLVAGEKGLCREIACVDSMEIPDISTWLKKKELLLTTGYVLRQDTGALLKLIEALHNAQSAGIAIKTRFFGALPEEALALADRYGLPLIEVPDAMPFVELMMPLMRAIMDAQNVRLEFSKTIHDQFTELELSGGGLDAVADMLHRLLSMPVVITDRDLKISAAAPEGAALRGDFHQILPEILAWAECTDFSEDVVEKPLGEGRLVARKARFKNNVCSYIFIFCPKNTFDEMHMVVLDHAVTVTALEFSKLEALNQRMSLMDNNCFIDIIMRNVKSEEEVRCRARYLGWPNPPFSLAVFDINGFEKLAQDRTELDILLLKQQVVDEIQAVMNASGAPCMVISKSDSFSCLCAGAQAVQLIEATKLTVQQVQMKLGIETTAGISTQVSCYMDLWAAYEEATDAIRIGRRGGLRTVYIEHARLEQALMHCADKNYFEKFVGNTAQKLVAYDRANGTELVRTLEALVRNMGVRTQTAQELFLHRNTLLARIRRIEAVTGYDLSRSEQLMDLGLALRMRPYL